MIPVGVPVDARREMGVRVLSLAKGPNKYIFRYTPGSEERVVDEIMRLADDPDTNLDWLDAATLGFQVAHYTVLGCKEAAKTVSQARDGDSTRRGGESAPPDHATDGPCAMSP